MQESSKNSDSLNQRIAINRKASYDYEIESRFEAGLVLMGWEVKSLRAGRGQISESYVIIKKSEAWLIGAQINALLSASTHINPDANRSRKLLLHRRQIHQLQGLSERQGYTLIPLSLYFKKGIIKLSFGLAKGKKQHDKRESEKERDWQRNKHRFLKIKSTAK